MSDREPKQLSQLKTHRLTLKESRNSLAMPLGIGLFLFALSVAALISGQRIGAGVFGIVALLQFVILPALWRRHVQVEQGIAVYVALPQSQLRMPQIVSLVIVLLVTAFVGVCSAFILYVVNLYFRTQTGWTVCGATLLALWLFVAYCWCRVLTEETQAKPVIFQEQPEGVWPPAPRVATKENNKD